MTTAAPRWVDLDRLVSEEVHVEMAALTERLKAQDVSLEDELLAEVLDQRWNDEIRGKDGVDDPETFRKIMEWTGYNEFSDAWVATGLCPHSVPLGSAD